MYVNDRALIRGLASINELSLTTHGLSTRLVSIRENTVCVMEKQKERTKSKIFTFNFFGCEGD